MAFKLVLVAKSSNTKWPTHVEKPQISKEVLKVKLVVKHVFVANTYTRDGTLKKEKSLGPSVKIICMFIQCHQKESNKKSLWWDIFIVIWKHNLRCLMVIRITLKHSRFYFILFFCLTLDDLNVKKIMPFHFTIQHHFRFLPRQAADYSLLKVTTPTHSPTLCNPTRFSWG